MRVLDLFSGIGGFSLGLERAGMRTVAFCEIDPYCCAVLAKHWPDVPCYDDVTTLTAARLAADGILADVADSAHDGHACGAWSSAVGERLVPSIAVAASGPASGTSEPRGRGIDLICGGFPCQDISFAGKGAGLAGERSGLWSEYARIIGEIRPRYVIVENVAALLGRGLDRVLGDLAALGYDAEWHCIPASAVGAPHRRDRIWIVAYADSGELRQQSGRRNGSRGASAAQPGQHGAQQPVADAEISGCGTWRTRRPFGVGARIREQTLPNTNGSRLSDGRQTGEPPSPNEASWRLAFPELERCGSAWWATEPDVGRVAHGVPARVDRLRALGNAVVPQIAEIIGRAIMATC